MLGIARPIGAEESRCPNDRNRQRAKPFAPGAAAPITANTHPQAGDISNCNGLHHVGPATHGLPAAGVSSRDIRSLHKINSIRLPRFTRVPNPQRGRGTEHGTKEVWAGVLRRECGRGRCFPRRRATLRARIHRACLFKPPCAKRLARSGGTCWAKTKAILGTEADARIDPTATRLRKSNGRGQRPAARHTDPPVGR